MTNEEYFQRLFFPLLYGERDNNGIDIALIHDNLRLTPEQRLRRGDAAARYALRLIAAGIIKDERQYETYPR